MSIFCYCTDLQEDNVTITVHSVQLLSEYVSIILEWSRQNFFYSYDIIIDPQAEAVSFSGSRMAQLTLSYNTLYNVSVVATHLCGRVSNVAAFIDELYYDGKFHNVTLILCILNHMGWSWTVWYACIIECSLDSTHIL